MSSLSGGSGILRPASAFTSCSAQPRSDTSAPAVSSTSNTAAVAVNLWPPSVALALPSAPTTFTSSPIQLLIADGVIESATAHSAPSCSRLTGGHISPARAPKRTAPPLSGFHVR